MSKVEIFAPGWKDRTSEWSASARLVNCYREATDGGHIIRGVLGSQEFAGLGGDNVRAGAFIGGMLYAAASGFLWSIDETGAATSLGAIRDHPWTTISGNNGSVTVAAGNHYSVWDGATLTEPTTGAFSSFSSVTFFGSKTVLTQRYGRMVQWSDPADPETLDALNFASTEARDDLNIRALPVGGSLWIWKQESIERWYDDGDLLPIPGATIETGLLKFNLLTAFPNGAFFVGSDGIAYIAAGSGLQPVSTPPVETAIKNDNPQTVTYYEDFGHKICVITFPNRPAWCFDLSKQEWHERAEGDGGAWDIKFCVKAYDKWFSFSDGQNVRLMTRNGEDSTGPLYRDMTGRTVDNNGDRFTIPKIKFYARVGAYDAYNEVITAVGDSTVLGLGGDDVLALEGDDVLLLSEGESTTSLVPVMLYADFHVSKDHGRTWGHPRTLALGHIGEYETQLVARALGQFRQFTPRLRFAGPYEVTFGAECVL